MDSHPSTIHHVVISHHNTVRGAREPPEKCNTKCAFDIILDQFRFCISLFNSLRPYSECTLVWLYGMLHCGKWAAAAKVTATTQNSNSNNCVCVCVVKSEPFLFLLDWQTFSANANNIVIRKVVHPAKVSYENCCLPFRLCVMYVRQTKTKLWCS